MLTDDEEPQTIPLDEALQEHPGETRQVDCKQNDIPAVLHYLKLLGMGALRFQGTSIQT